MKKLLSLVCTLALLTVALSSCGAKLPDGMSEENVLAAANNVVALLNDEKYAEICDTMSGEMLTAIKGEAEDAATAFENIWQPVAAEIGKFVKTDKTATTGKDGFAMAVLLCKYENKDITFTLSFDKDMKLAGFFYK